MDDQWFAESDELSLKIGIKYDDEIKKKHPQVDESKEANNENMCKICFCEFEDEEGWRADSLECGHQYNGLCWTQFLQNQVKSEGPGCVMTKCPQSKCNMVVPHSFFIKYLKNEVEKDDEGQEVNYYNIYMKWHCKQMVDSNKNMKWCPLKDCKYIIDRPPYSSQSVVECKCSHKFCFYCKNEDHMPASCD